MIHRRSLALKVKMSLNLATGWRKARLSLMLPYVIEHRPYSTTRELVTKRVLTEEEYNQIAPHVKAGEVRVR